MMEKVSPSLFILVIICFALPFVNISCAGQPAETLSGIDLITGFKAGTTDVAPNPLAIIAVAAALIGAFLFFVKTKTGHVIQSILGILGIISLVALKILFSQGANDEGLGTEWTTGYFAAMGSFAGAVLASICSIFAESNPASAPAAYNTGPGIMCPSCYKLNEAGNNWCQWCGANMQNQPQSPINNVSAQSFNANYEQATPAKQYESSTVAMRPAETPAATPIFTTAASAPNAGIAESVTMPLRPESVPILNNQPVAFLRIQRIGRWELIPILKDEFIIGSDPTRADYQENSGNLNQVHAIIERIDGTYKISSIQTDSETYINNQKLSVNMFSLYPGDVIRLNDVEYTFDLA
ncbi:MAG: FHA domain-containing protein [Methanobacterium sp.]